MAELFPLRIVTGKRFCNREQEKAFLKACIDQRNPAVLISPRRYGKSSLANKVVEELQYPFCSIDFLTAYDDQSICQSIIRGIAELVSQIMPINMKTVQFIENCFQGIKAVVRYKLIELEFVSPLERVDPSRQVLEALQGLERLAVKLNKPVVVFIDEFQRILETPKGEAIQGAIRHVAQLATQVAFLFSGSSRHMLSKVFDDSHLPLYMMCEKLHLGRIASQHYFPYIQEAAQLQWKTTLQDTLIQHILELTENHSFYVNYLCGRIWQKNHPPHTTTDIDQVWHECLLSEERRLAAELERLTLNQRVLLKAIANTSSLKEPTSSAFLSPLSMASGTAAPVLKVLTNKDMIFVDDSGSTRVLDPLMKYMLQSPPAAVH